MAFILTMSRCPIACLLLLLAFVLCNNHIQLSHAKVYTRCGIAEELLKLHFQRTFIGNWVCLIEAESGKDTAKVTTKPNRSKNLGLFQINNKEWCKEGKPGGKCNMKCENLLNEDITDDAACAKKVYATMGFQGWDGWRRSCYRRDLPLPNC